MRDPLNGAEVWGLPKGRVKSPDLVAAQPPALYLARGLLCSAGAGPLELTAGGNSRG